MKAYKVGTNSTKIAKTINVQAITRRFSNSLIIVFYKDEGINNRVSEKRPL